MCYACLAMVTDYDVSGGATRPGVREYVEVMHRNADRMGQVLARVIPRLAGEKNCRCAHALDDAGSRSTADRGAR